MSWEESGQCWGQRAITIYKLAFRPCALVGGLLMHSDSSVLADVQISLTQKSKWSEFRMEFKV
jgi:hypothetical protein